MHRMHSKSKKRAQDNGAKRKKETIIFVEGTGLSVTGARVVNKLSNKLEDLLEVARYRVVETPITITLLDGEELHREVGIHAPAKYQGTDSGIS